MARTKLIAKYAALDTPDLAERIRKFIDDHIAAHGVEDLPLLELNGRWTGKLSLSSGGWRGDFDLLRPVLAMCRVDRHGVVSADIAKIEKEVASWREYLHTPDENDIYMGVDDENFRDEAYDSDDENSFKSAAYDAEYHNFINSDNPDMLAYDNALTQIDKIFERPGADSDKHDYRLGDDWLEDEYMEENDWEEDDWDSDFDSDGHEGGGRLFQEGFNVRRITSAEELKKMFESMEREAEAGGGTIWTDPDIDYEELAAYFNEQEARPSWMEFIDDLRNGRYGDLPEDYDGLAADDEPSDFRPEE